MTRKDFEAIANILRGLKEDAVDARSVELHQAHRQLTVSMGNYLRSTNPNFDRDRFRRACGLTDPDREAW